MPDIKVQMMQTAPDISVIIPVYNTEPYIEACLDSVIRQKKGPTVEVIVVDDGSTDRSGEIAEDFSARHPIVTVIHQLNGGLSAARNAGIKEAKGRYLYFLDSDDTLPEDALEQLWKLVETYGKVDLVYGRTQAQPQSERYRKYYAPERARALTFDNNLKRVRKVHARMPVIACNRLMRRQWVVDNDLFFRPGILHEDFEWHLRAYELVRSYCTADNVTYLRLVRDSSITGSQTLHRKMRCIWTIIVDTLPKLKEPDAPIMRLIMEQAWYLRRFRRDHADKKLYDRVLEQMRIHPSVKKTHKRLTHLIGLYPKWLPVKPFLWLIR